MRTAYASLTSVQNLGARGMLGALDVHDGESLRAGGDVGVGARHVDIARVGQRHGGFDRGLLHVGDVDDFQPFGIAGEEVAELDRGVARALQRDHGDHLGLQRMIDVHDRPRPGRRRRTRNCPR